MRKQRRQMAGAAAALLAAGLLTGCGGSQTADTVIMDGNALHQYKHLGLLCDLKQYLMIFVIQFQKPLRTVVIQMKLM